MSARSLADRVAVWKRDRMARCAAACVSLATIAAMVSWVLVSVPSGGNIRGKPLFWLIALLPSLWIGALNESMPWALRWLRPALLAAPCLAFAAMVFSWRLLDAATNATPSWMLGLFAGSVLCSGLGALALARSTLPGGSARPQDLPPATPSLPPLVRAALQLGSISLTGTVVNGILFASATIAGLGNPIAAAVEQFWPVLIPCAAIAVTAGLMLRGMARAQQSAAGAWRDLRWSIDLGGIGACVLLVLLWAWPIPDAVKVGFSVFMGPMAVAAVWTGWVAQQWLRNAMPHET